jgi:hypothetical protein
MPRGGKPTPMLGPLGDTGITVLALAPTPAGKRPCWWLCRCHCGREFTAYGHRLRSGKASSCGCARRESNAAKAVDLVGYRHPDSFLVAVSPTTRRTTQGNVIWLCRCSPAYGGCGGTREVAANYLKRGKVRSCGCVPRGRKKKT